MRPNRWGFEGKAALLDGGLEVLIADLVELRVTERQRAWSQEGVALRKEVRSDSKEERQDDAVL